MRLAPINPADRLTLAGRYAPAGPEIVGAEGFGIVDAVGEGVSAFAPGDRVIPLSRGNWTAWRTVGAAGLLKVPEGLADQQAAMLRINPATAWRLLDRLGLSDGDWLVQNAARASVARWVRRIAARRRLRVVDVVRAPARDGEVEEGEDLEARVEAAAGGAPMRGALDAVAGEASGRLAACLAPNGTLLVYGHLSGRPVSVPSILLTTRQLVVAGFSLRPAEQSAGLGALESLYGELAEMAIAAPEPVAYVHPLSQLEAALAGADAPGEGRVLLALDR